MLDDPYGGRKPGCFDITVALLAMLLLALAGAGAVLW